VEAVTGPFVAIGRAVGQFFAALGPSDFTIRHRPGKPITVRGRVARSKIPAIGEFFARDLDLTGPATVRGSWAGPALRLRISGNLGPSQKQRVRNFLFEHLR
jgi:hypothetical protein